MPLYRHLRLAESVCGHWKMGVWSKLLIFKTGASSHQSSCQAPVCEPCQGRFVLNSPDPHDSLPRPPPMTLANMRANGVHSLCGMCEPGRHEAVMNVDPFSDTVSVPTLAPRMVCTSSGILGADVRPNCLEGPQPESLTGIQWTG
jgi:hypothetical protein